MHPKNKLIQITSKVVFLLIFVATAIVSVPQVVAQSGLQDDWQFDPKNPVVSTPQPLPLNGPITYAYTPRYDLDFRSLSLFYESVRRLTPVHILVFIGGIISVSVLPLGLHYSSLHSLNTWVVKRRPYSLYEPRLSKKTARLLVTIGITSFILLSALSIFSIELGDIALRALGIGANVWVIFYSLLLVSLLIFLVMLAVRKITQRKWSLRVWGLHSLAVYNAVYVLILYAAIQYIAFVLGFSALGEALSNVKTTQTVGTISPNSVTPGSGWSSGVGAGLSAPRMMRDTVGSMPSTSENIGFSVGGAKDINNFRENIKNDYFPLLTDLTYEGLFYDYYFDTSGEASVCHDLFCPAYSYAYSEDPISKKPEHYVSVGLNSNISEADFQRKKLNLVIVMDISGSMGEQFNQYYYDAKQQPNQDETKSKMAVANESVVALLNHLKPEDRVGMVLFDDNAYLAKPVNLVGETDMNAIRSHILGIQEQGSTNMEAGYQEGTRLLEEFAGKNKDEYENRIIFITDAQPNTGVLDEYSLAGMTRKNADKGIYTTFIGVGVDFNSELIEAMTKVKGANYYAVHNSIDFMKRMDQGFEYMVTPLVFDLQLQFLSQDFDIEKVYGSPEADLANGQIMYVNTLFPSDSEGGEVKGGVILLKLKPKYGMTGSARLVARYKTRTGEAKENLVDVNVSDTNGEFYGSTGIHKAIILTRYANLIHFWVEDERAAGWGQIPVQPRITAETGILIPPELESTGASAWERQSVPLRVSREYGSLFNQFRSYFALESQVLQDQSMNQELSILDKLVTKSGLSLTPVQKNSATETPLGQITGN